MTENMTRHDLVEALAALDTLEKHAAVQTFFASASADEASALELILEVPDSIEAVVRREQAIGELRAARNARSWISDWKRAAEQAIHDIDNQPTTHNDNEP